MLLSVNKVRIQFGIDIVLDDVSFRVERGEKIALVGRNGSGKTTLLKILTGEYEPTSGSAQIERGAKVGYLSQMGMESSNKTVLQVATEAREHLIEIQSRLNEVEALLEHSSTPELLDEFSMLHEHFHAEGGYSVENDLKVVLQRLGFQEDEFDKPINKLSGGERTRLSLAKLLLEEPELLILDEPTNHLDISAIEWLEGWVRGYGGAVLIVSHDREFLQRTAGRIIELRNGVTRTFPGPFNHYLELARAEDARLADIAQKQQVEMEKLDEFVRRFMNSQRTAQARGRLKMLERMKSQAIIAPKSEKGIAAGFSKVTRSGDIVIDCKSLTQEFAEQKLFADVSWTVHWGDRWGIIGENGAGKSTLVKIAIGKMTPTSGTARLGSSVNLGYFSQDVDFLDPAESPLEAVCNATGLEFGPARTLLGRFLISGDDSLRKIKTLSGGERVKVALAILTALQPNVLVLDEPTNHLDIDSREALADVLKEFPGTLVVVSHDRWFLSQISKQILNIERKKVTEFPGSYSEYAARLRNPAPPVTSTKSTAKAATISPPISEAELLSPRELSKRIDRIEKDIVKREAEIATLEDELEKLERVMARPTPDADLHALGVQHQKIHQSIDSLLENWTELGSQLEEFKEIQARGGSVGVSFRQSQ